VSQYTDSAFGFSFWYPTAWKVTEEPVADPTADGWFPDAKILKELRIQNTGASDDNGQPSGVIIRELSAPAGLTELGRSKSPSPVGIDEKYFFDSGKHRWMNAQLTEAPDGSPPATFPLKIERRTMGGLPLFYGAARGGAEVIVPLNASHFLALTTLEYPDDSHNYLAATVVATDAGAGKRASTQEQADTIRRMAVKLQAIGEPVGYWYKDSQHVYNFDGSVLRGADPKTFAPLSNDGDGSSYATDGVHVYRAYLDAIPGADPKTFVATGPDTAKDAHHTYDWSTGSVKIRSH
jgi:hypothetical protein